MDIELVNHFISQVYKYYPVGFVQFIPQYEGHLEINRIVTNKIDKECNNVNSVSRKLAKSIKEGVPLLEVENRDYFMFPNYVISIYLFPKHEGRIIHISQFEICISLLCDYYTYYLIDDYKFEGFYDEKLASRFTVFSCEQSSKKLSELIPLVTNSLQSFFPEKKYVPYSFLTGHSVYGAVPYNEMWHEVYSIQTKHSFFDLLFDLNYIKPRKDLK